MNVSKKQHQLTSLGEIIIGLLFENGRIRKQVRSSDTCRDFDTKVKPNELIMKCN